MPSCTIAGCLAALSIAWSVSAQTAAPKPKPARKPAVATKPVDKPAPPQPAPVAPPPPTDLQIRTKYTNGPQVSENVTYFKGMRQRFEFPGITLITQCDLKRNLQVQQADETLHGRVDRHSGGAAGGHCGRPDRGSRCNARRERRRRRRGDHPDGHRRTQADVRARGTARQDSDCAAARSECMRCDGDQDRDGGNGTPTFPSMPGVRLRRRRPPPRPSPRRRALIASKRGRRAMRSLDSR